MASSSLRRYFHSNGVSTTGDDMPAPYALVTGSTGGMGEEWALQLAALGFNVIIQGRNKGKLETVRKNILSTHTRPGPPPIVKLLVTEATVYPNEKLTSTLSAFLQDPLIRLTVVINNLGVVSEGYPKLEDETSEGVAQVIIANAIFPAEITRIALPWLKKYQPSLLVTITSIGAWASPPYLSPYAGTKGFDVSFSRSMYNEMAEEGHEVDVVCMIPGQVVSGMHEGPPGIMVPTSKDWVKSAVRSLEPAWWWSWWSSRPSNFITPWPAQAFGQTFVNWGPSFIVNRTARSMVKEMQNEYKRKKRSE